MITVKITIGTTPPPNREIFMTFSTGDKNPVGTPRELNTLYRLGEYIEKFGHEVMQGPVLQGDGTRPMIKKLNNE